MKKRLFHIFLFTLVLVLVIGGYQGSQMLPIATSYKAKILCSCLFVSERPLEDALAEDLSSFSYISQQVDRANKSVTASLFGLFERQAIYRKGKGCTLLNGKSKDELLAQGTLEPLNRPAGFDTLPWPYGDNTQAADTLAGTYQAERLQAAIAEAFKNPPQGPIHTRAILVSYKGQLIAEQYAPGITTDTRLTGWSMTKSVTHALTGLMVKQNILQLNQDMLLKEWRGASDERQSITLNHLLQMNSGLDFTENYGRYSDVTHMLFRASGAGKYALTSDLANPPGSQWYYSSGTTNIISLKIYRELNKMQDEPLRFAYDSLFKPLGMYSAVMEPDADGVWVGSSFMFATARDWTRLGMLYLQKGRWGKQQILPAYWTDYAAERAPNTPMGEYGAHFWLNAGNPENKTERKWPSLPTDIFYMSGFEGQYVVIIPSEDLVVTRLGLANDESLVNMEKLLREVILSVKQP